MSTFLHENVRNKRLENLRIKHFVEPTNFSQRFEFSPLKQIQPFEKNIWLENVLYASFHGQKSLSQAKGFILWTIPNLYAKIQ